MRRVQRTTIEMAGHEATDTIHGIEALDAFNESYDLVILDMTGKTDAVIGRLIDVAAKVEKTPTQVAIAWLLDHPEVTAPIIGPDVPDQVDETFGAVGWELGSQNRHALDAASAVALPAHVA